MASNSSNAPYSSYQQGATFQTYAEQQTGVIHDTVKTQYEAEGTATAVLGQMNAQRHQIKGANDDVWAMREATAKAKRELEELREKNLRKKRRLYYWIAGLATVDFLLFMRLIQCHGHFFFC